MFNVDGTNTLNPSDNPNFNPLQQGWQIHSKLAGLKCHKLPKRKNYYVEDLINDKFETLSSVFST